MGEDSIDDDQQLQMALQMSLDEISMAKSRNLSKYEEESKSILPQTVQKIISKNTDVPVILPK